MNKIDIDPDLADEVDESIKSVLGLDKGIRISAKTGLGIEELIRFICVSLSSPKVPLLNYDKTFE